MMNDPEHDSHDQPELSSAEPFNPAAAETITGVAAGPTSSELAPAEPLAELSRAIEPAPALADQPLFQNWQHLPPPPAVRNPHMGHLLLLGAFAIGGLLAASLLLQLALHFHWYGITTLQQATTDIHYNLASEAVLYSIMFASALFFFPLLWQRPFFATLEWNGQTAYQLRTRLFLLAIGCFLFALLSSLWLPGPKDAPIDKIFRSDGAPWLLFAFGVTIAPLCEELIFRGFLLPALCTAFDWTAERMGKQVKLPLTAAGAPQWTPAAMITATLVTSLLFAAIHLAQTAYSLGPFLLLLVVSAVLCATRLLTRSLAASILVHSSYNFLLFSTMLVGTTGFRHLDKL